MKRLSASLLTTLTFLINTNAMDNPYADINWSGIEYIHSFSHQHATRAQFDDLYKMGYRHFPISNYYPSKPIYPLPADFTERHPDVIAAPNAEQHSTLDSGMHFNVVGSFYSTGHGNTPRVNLRKSPVESEFKGLNIFDRTKEPWRGVYRLDLHVEPLKGKDPKTAKVYLSIEGAKPAPSDYRGQDEEPSVERIELTPASARSISLRAYATNIKVRIEFDESTTYISRFRLMQGTYRPWRDAFRAGLDGHLRDGEGNLIEGLLYNDGGGITINHPGESAKALKERLDFDPRVLGIEVWNYRRTFGVRQNISFYDTWDELLASGRRCYGFFVKDHRLYGRGRNILLMPEGITDKTEREKAALRAYRNGNFFGSLGPMTVGTDGEPAQPYDYSNFRFTNIALRMEDGEAVGLDVSVDGTDETKRPNTQIRFITEGGIAQISEGKKAYYPFPETPGEEAPHTYVRVEAFAYPDTHLEGQPLTKADIDQMNVFEIARLHDVKGRSNLPILDVEAGETPLGIVDMIFSQAIMLK